MASADKRLLCHVTCGTNKRKISCTAEKLTDKIREEFELENSDLKIQSWDDEFDDWEDIDDISVLGGKDKWKLNVVIP